MADFTADVLSRYYVTLRLDNATPAALLSGWAERLNFTWSPRRAVEVLLDPSIHFKPRMTQSFFGGCGSK